MSKEIPGLTRYKRRHIHIPSHEQAVRRLIEVSKNSWLGTDCKARAPQQQPRNPHRATDYFGMD